MSKQSYPVAYRIIPCTEKPMTREELKAADDLGGADAVVIHSILLPEDGSRNEAIFSFNGTTGKPVDDIELFKCMVSLAYQLSQSKTLGEGRRAFAENIFNEVRRAILSAREEKK